MIWRVGVFSQSWLTHHELLSGHFSPSCQVFGDSHEPACQLIYCRFFFPRSCCIFVPLLLQKDTLFINFPNTFLYIFHIQIAPAVCGFSFCFFPPSILAFSPTGYKRLVFPVLICTTMSCIHRLLNALLRGLVISAVLGSVCSHSNGLPSQPSDAAAAVANVATTGKLQAIYHTTGLGVEGRFSI